MELWIQWFNGVRALRKACSRKRTFTWMVLALLGLSIRGDLLGVTSIIRAGFIHEKKYRRLLHFFHSPALNLKKLTTLWVQFVLRVFRPVTFGDYLLLIADGLKVPKEGHHLVTRVRITTRGYYPATLPKKPKPGRPKVYGKKVLLRHDFKRVKDFTTAPSPVYGETKINIQYLCKDLLWRPVGRIVRFVLVVHPTRGRMMLMTTLTSLDPLDVIRIYGYRFKIEVSFKQAVHTLGTYAYHFWMKEMTPIRKGSGNQYLHRKTEAYRHKIKRKIDAYHRYVQLGCIAQGLLQYLSVMFGKKVWLHFNSWLRTMNTEKAPSEMVVAQALRASLPKFLVVNQGIHDLEKFILENADLSRLPEMRLAG